MHFVPAKASNFTYMTLSQFRSLSLLTQRAFVKREGVFLMEFNLAQLSGYLFELDDFYVEILYDHEKSTEVMIVSFGPEDESLNRYLQQIDLSPIYSLLGSSPI
jgi:hypothetical protein